MSLLRRTFVLATGSGTARALGVVIFVLLARVLGIVDFGKFGFALSLALLLTVVIDMGQGAHIGRIVAQDAENGPSEFGNVLVNKVAFTVAGAIALGAVVRLAGFGVPEALTVSLMALWAGFLSILDSLRAIARSLDLLRADSLINGGESLLRLGAVALAWALGADIVGFGAAFAVECGVAALGFYWWLGRRTKLARPKLDLSSAWRFLRASMPLGIAGMAFVGFYQVDQVFVRTVQGTVPGVVYGAAANGLYGAATRIVFATAALGGLVAQAAYPRLAAARDDIARFGAQARSALRVAVSLSLPTALAVFLLASPIIRVLYGADYADAAALLRALCPVIALDSLVIVSMTVANALGREKRVLVVVGVLLAVNVAANYLLIPLYGAAAAAWISSAEEAALVVGLLAVTRDRLRVGGAAREV